MVERSLFIKKISGAQALVIIFICTSLFTKFNLPFHFFFIFILIFSFICLLFQLKKRNGLKISSRIEFWHYLLIFYLISIFIFNKLVDFNYDFFPHFWNGQSVLVLISVLMADIVVLKTSSNDILKTLRFLKYISYIMILESFFSIIIPNNFNIFVSDFEAGYRFTSILTPGYVYTGLFLILGYTSFLHLNSSASKRRIFLIFLCFCFALIQTKDRTSILTFMILNAFVLYKSANSRSITMSIFKKTSFFLKVILMFAVLYFSLMNFGDRKNFMSLTSSLDRYVIFVRGLNVTEAVLPIGGGPGSQSRLMTYSKIPFNQSLTSANIEDKNELTNIERDLNYSKNYMRKKIGSNKTLSPHNTYLDFTISLGLVGILIVIFILYIQLRSLGSLLVNQISQKYFLNAMFVSIFIIFIYTSFITSIWIFLIYYRATQIYDSQNK